MPRIYKNKRDSVEADIVAALRASGCVVERGQDVDLYVSCNVSIPTQVWGCFQIKPMAFLMEVKVPGKAKKLRPIQERLKAIFGAQYLVVSTPSEALAACGIEVKG